MISVSSLVPGPPPRPRCRPTALLSPKKCCAKRSLTIATLELSLHVSPVEVAAFQKRNAHGLEIARRERVHEGLHVFAVLGLMALHRRAAVPFIAVQQRDGGQRRRFTPGSRAHVIQKFLIKVHRSRRIVSVQRGRDLERDQVIEITESRIGGLQILQAPDEQPGAE